MIFINYNIKDLPIYERPRERLINNGVSNLSNIELLEIILKSGVKGKSVNSLAVDLLNKFSINELSDISINDLIKVEGIGIAKACELISSIELGKRIFFKVDTNNKLSSPKEIWEDSKYLFFGKKQELFYCYYFDCKNNLLNRKCLFMGTNNRSITHTREVFKEAYRLSAASIVCLHNHPSGDVTPSNDDIIFTNHLMETGKIQGIPVVDHIIVGNDRYYSFYEDKNIFN